MVCVVRRFDKREVSTALFNAFEQQYRRHCAGAQSDHGVRAGYVRAQYKRSDYIFVAIDDTNRYYRNGAQTRSGALPKVCGFLFLQHNAYHAHVTKCAYIDIVCSADRTGRLLLDAAEDFTKKELGLDCVQLSALDHVVCYYAKRGYRKTDGKHTCDDDAKIVHKGTAENGYRMTKCVRNGKGVSTKILFPKSCR
jgi:hypothetical protein